jgi:uncharacterized protein (TIGR03435 family)
MTEAIQWAYNTEFYQVSGPVWVPATRFGLQAHREDKEMPGMALLAAEAGPKLEAGEDQGGSVFEPIPKKLAFHMNRMSMKEFAALLSEPMHKPAVDLTEIPGTFELTLDASNFAPAMLAPGQPHKDDDSYLVMRVLPDPLGLRLEPRKLNINVVIADRIEKSPTNN